MKYNIQSCTPEDQTKYNIVTRLQVYFDNKQLDL